MNHTYSNTSKNRWVQRGLDIKIRKKYRKYFCNDFRAYCLHPKRSKCILLKQLYEEDGLE